MTALLKEHILTPQPIRTEEKKRRVLSRAGETRESHIRGHFTDQ